MYIKLNQSQWLDLSAELRNLLLFFSHLSFRVLKFENNVLISGSSVWGFSLRLRKIRKSPYSPIRLRSLAFAL